MVALIHGPPWGQISERRGQCTVTAVTHYGFLRAALSVGMGWGGGEGRSVRAAVRTQSSLWCTQVFGLGSPLYAY